MALLFVASEAMELRALESHLTGLRPLKWPLDYAQEGILDGRRIILAANGAGPKLAAHALEIALRAISAADLQSSALEAVVSIGFCGALQPDLRAGQVVVATNVTSCDSSEIYPCFPVESPEPYISGAVISQDRIIGLAAEKLALGSSSQALVAEMEAFGVAARAKRAGLPFFCIKVVSDSVDESFCLDFNQVRTPDGRISRAKIVGRAIAKPAVIPSLFRLRRRAHKVAGLLGDFLVSCRFSVQSVQVEAAGEAENVN